MDGFWKISALILIAMILTSAIGKQEKDIAMLLSMIACCMAAMIALSYLEPVLDLLRELETLGQMQDGFLGILLKAAGIALITELTAMICSDAGNGSLAKIMHIIGAAVILYLSIPLFQALLTLVREILGQL